MGQFYKREKFGKRIPIVDTVYVGRRRVHTGADIVGNVHKDGISIPINGSGIRRRLARYKKMTLTSQ